MWNFVFDIRNNSHKLKMDIKSRITQKIPLLFFSALFAGSISVLCLFNLPLFYEQDRFGWLATFLITFVIFSLAIAFSFKLLLIPLNYFKEKNTVNILLVTFLSLLLASVFYFTASYYWSTPNFQSVEICYESNDPSGILNLNRISDARIGRVLPADFFGYENYPISVPTHTCLTGGIRTVQKWQGIIIDLDEKSGGDFIEVKINRLNTIWPLADNDGIATREVITIPASAYRGAPIYPNIFSSYMLIFVKWISLILSSIYLALFVFALSEIIIFPSHESIVSHKTALILVLIYFIGFGFLMANHGGQPDQGKHGYFSSRYSETWGFPEEQPESPYFVKDNVYFYYWLNGVIVKLSRLFITHIDSSALSGSEIFLLRLFSVVLSTGTLFYIYKLASKVSGNKFGGVLAAFFAANTLMFVFVSGGINFDNFISLSSVAAIYHLVSIMKQQDYVKNTALMGIYLCLGALSKNEGALLAFILFLIWLVYSVTKRKTIELWFTRANIILIVILAVTSGLFLEFYGGNLLRYHRPIPKCEDVKPIEVCTRFAERRSLRQELDFSELWTNRNSITGPFEYAFNFWLLSMLNGIWGIVSHNTYVPKFLTSLHGYLMIWGALCMARNWEKRERVPTILLILVASYAGYLFYFNYLNELRMGFRHFAVQGRYLFPVLGVFFALMVNYFLAIRLLPIRRMTLSLAIIVYFAGGLGTFIFRYSDVFVSWRVFFLG